MNGVALTVLQAEPERGHVRGSLVFAANFAGYDGHFPEERGGAVLPAFCQVQAAVDLLESALDRKLALRSMDLAKFLHAILPGDIVNVELNLLDNQWHVAMRVGDVECSRFLLSCEAVDRTIALPL